MSSPRTFPVPIPGHAAPQAQTTGAAHHEHGWVTESRHPTSEGVVVYVRCTGCGRRRVDVQHLHMPPVPLSRESSSDP